MCTLYTSDDNIRLTGHARSHPSLVAIVYSLTAVTSLLCDVIEGNKYHSCVCV